MVRITGIGFTLSFFYFFSNKLTFIQFTNMQALDAKLQHTVISQKNHLQTGTSPTISTTSSRKYQQRNNDYHRQFTDWTITKKYCLSWTEHIFFCWEAVQTINYIRICKHVDFSTLLFFCFLFSNTTWYTFYWQKKTVDKI